MARVDAVIVRDGEKKELRVQFDGQEITFWTSRGVVISVREESDLEAVTDLIYDARLKLFPGEDTSADARSDV